MRPAKDLAPVIPQFSLVTFGELAQPIVISSHGERLVKQKMREEEEEHTAAAECHATVFLSFLLLFCISHIVQLA